MSDRRGSILAEAADVINGERQDMYGAPEDSFATIADLWNLYLRQRNGHAMIATIGKSDVAMMMTLFKIARESHQHKRDNIRDAAGYLGIYADMQANAAAEPEPMEFEWKRNVNPHDEILNRR